MGVPGGEMWQTTALCHPGHKLGEEHSRHGLHNLMVCSDSYSHSKTLKWSWDVGICVACVANDCIENGVGLI